MKIKIYQILNILGLIGVLVVNFLANALPIAGLNTGEVSANNPSLFAPAGITFSIWGVIYILLIIFAGYQSRGLFSSKRTAHEDLISRIGIWFFISCLANMAWIFAWHHQVLWLSMLLMLVILFSLITIYLRLNIGRRIVGKNENNMGHRPFSIYLAWITVATIANAAALLGEYGWDGFGIPAPVWTSAMIAVASLVGLMALFIRKDIFFALVLVWAFAGIIYKRGMAGEDFYLSIVVFASAGIVVLVATIIFQLVKKYARKE